MNLLEACAKRKAERVIPDAELSEYKSEVARRKRLIVAQRELCESVVATVNGWCERMPVLKR